MILTAYNPEHCEIQTQCAICEAIDYRWRPEHKTITPALDSSRANLLRVTRLNPFQRGACSSNVMESPTLRHGHARRDKKTPTYKTWKDMRKRCHQPSFKDWHLYGGRGITVCKRWDLFENFLADMGHKPYGLTLDRIDSNGNYEPANCRWATLIQQARNRSNNHIVAYDGRQWTLAELAETFGIRQGTLSLRLKRGKSIEQAVESPLNAHFLLTVNGVTKSKPVWAQELGIKSFEPIGARIRNGWTVEKAVSTPFRKWERHK